MNREDKIREIFMNTSGVSSSLIKDNSLLKYDLVISSICYIKIITKLEDEFGIEFDSKDLELTDEMTFQSFLTKIEGIIESKQKPE